MAQIDVCDRCRRSPNGLKAVVATFGPEVTVKFQGPSDVVSKKSEDELKGAVWSVKLMCPGCQGIVEARIAKAMAPPVKRSKIMVDLESS